MRRGTIARGERDRGRAGRDRVAVGEGRADGAGHDRRRAGLDLPPPGRAPAGSRGRRAGRQHLRRLPRGRRRRHGAGRDGRGSRAPRGLGPHGRRRRGLGPRPRLQRRDRGVHRAGRAAAEVAGALRMALEEERPICVVTVVESTRPGVEPGARLVVRPDGRPDGSLGDAAVEDEPRSRPRASCSTRAVEIRRSTGGRPRVRRGAGAAAAAGDLRGRARRDPARASGRRCSDGTRRRRRPPAFLTRERFPEATGFVMSRNPSDAAKAAGSTSERSSS